MASTPSPTENRRLRERRERRTAILDAARSVLFSQGIAQTTMDDVAAAAELSKGTIYLYFQSKETLLAALLQEGLTLLVKQLEAAYGTGQPLPAVTRLRRLARAYFDFFQKHPHYYRLLMALDRRQFQESVEPDIYRQILIRSTRGLTYVVQVIEQGVADGDFYAENPREAASVIWATLHGVYIILGHPLRREMVAADLEQLYQAALELAIKGLTSRTDGTARVKRKEGDGG
jgi:AcrR family transcriptional regulator